MSYSIEYFCKGNCLVHQVRPKALNKCTLTSHVRFQRSYDVGFHILVKIYIVTSFTAEVNG